ncbi:MAG: hypothetical protein RL208_247 [Pseudomonadota bacterium]|jgi:outer membrane protein assembly factor BamE (lipoprotein component of BamABCDE complex)
MTRYLFLIFLITSCTTVYQGYPLKNIDHSKLVIGLTAKDSIRMHFGTPTLSSNHIDCYIEAKGYKFMFLRFANAKYNRICFKYDNNNILQEIVNKTDNDIKFEKDDNPSFKLSLEKPK